MHTEIPKTYTAKDWEEKLYARWEESGLFNPDTSASQERYCNILPPPNANGELHNHVTFRLYITAMLLR